MLKNTNRFVRNVDRLSTNTESRFCDRCMMKRIHYVIEEEDVVYTYKRKKFYRCKTCGRNSFKRGLRPTAESVY